MVIQVKVYQIKNSKKSQIKPGLNRKSTSQRKSEKGYFSGGQALTEELSFALTRKTHYKSENTYRLVYVFWYGEKIIGSRFNEEKKS